MTDMIRVRMLTMASGPDFQAHPDQEIDLPAATAEALIEGGYAQRITREVAAPVEPEATDEGQDADEDWTSTPQEAVRAADTTEAPMETATSGPQRQNGADDLVAAEKAGKEAAADNQPRSDNPYDRRTSMGRAWDRGWDSAQE